MLNICKFQGILENVFCERKNLNFDICKISLSKNFINLKPLMSFSIDHMRLTKQLFANVKWG